MIPIRNEKDDKKKSTSPRMMSNVYYSLLSGFSITARELDTAGQSSSHDLSYLYHFSMARVFSNGRIVKRKRLATPFTHNGVIVVHPVTSPGAKRSKWLGKQELLCRRASPR